MDLSDEEEKRQELESRLNQFKSGSDKDSGAFSPWKGLSILGSLGFLVAVSILVGLGVGNYLDRRWHTQPWLTLVGLVLGLIMAALGSYDLVQSVLKERK